VLLEKKSKSFPQHRVIDIAEVFRVLAANFMSKYFGFPLKSDKHPKYLSSLELFGQLAELFDFLFLDNNTTRIAKLYLVAVTPPQDLASFVTQLIKGKAAPDSVIGHLAQLQKSDHTLKDEILAYNVIGTMIGGCGPLQKACTEVLNFLLSSTVWPDVVNAASNNEDDKLISYVLESMRLKPIFPAIPRLAISDCSIQTGQQQILIKKDQIVSISLSSALNDPSVFPDPTIIKIDRNRDNYLFFGYSFHECLARFLVPVFITTALKPVFLLKNIRRANGRSGRLLYESLNGDVGPWPTSMIMWYDN